MGYEQLLVDEVQVADALALQPYEVRRMAEHGLMPCRRLPNGARRFDPTEIREWVRQLQHASEPLLT
jgi:hypothetical protein